MTELHNGGVNQPEKPSISSYLVHRMVVPLTCGALGGVLALSLHSAEKRPAEAPTDGCKDVAAQVSALQALMRERSTLPPAEAAGPGQQQVAPALAPVAEQTQQLAEGFLAEAKKAKEELVTRRVEREARRATEDQAQAEVELVKLQHLQNTIPLEQTKTNVARRLKNLGLSQADLAQASELGAPYIRQRSDTLIKILEQYSTGTKVSPRDVEEKLRPLDENLLRSLPSNLDDRTRRAVVTELSSMVRVPFFLRSESGR